MVVIDNPTWAERVMAVRLKLNLTQVQLALRLNITQTAVSDWERYTRRPYSAGAERFLELEREALDGEVQVDSRWGLDP